MSEEQQENGQVDEAIFEEVAMLANDKVDALIELLIDKGVISAEEYDEKYNQIIEETYEDDDDEEAE